MLCCHNVVPGSIFIFNNQYIHTMKRSLIILAVLCLTITTHHVQAQVGIGTTTPNASSALEVQSTTKGILVSRMTAAQKTAIASPAEGLMVYQTDAPIGLWMYISGAWVRLTTANDLLGASSGFAANTTGAVIPVVLGGTSVPLPSAQNLGSNITPNGANTIFTVAAAGRYRIAYGLNFSTTFLVSSRLVINGTANIASTVIPVTPMSTLSAEVIVTLTAGATITLELFGLLGAVTLLNNTQGAALTIQRVE